MQLVSCFQLYIKDQEMLFGSASGDHTDNRKQNYYPFSRSEVRQSGITIPLRTFLGDDQRCTWRRSIGNKFVYWGCHWPGSNFCVTSSLAEEIEEIANDIRGITNNHINCMRWLCLWNAESEFHVGQRDLHTYQSTCRISISEKFLSPPLETATAPQCYCYDLHMWVKKSIRMHCPLREMAIRCGRETKEREVQIWKRSLKIV